MDTKEVLATLKKLGKPQTAAIYRRHGSGDNAFGVLTSKIAKLQKKIKVDHALAMELWKTGKADARLDEVAGRVPPRDGLRNSRRPPEGRSRLGQDAAGLPLEPPDREHRGERRADLEAQNRQRLSGRSGEPLDGEERHDRDLSHHEELPEVGSGSLIGLTGNAERRSVANHRGEGGDRHRDWKKGARPLEQCAVHQNLRHQMKAHT
jgi:hypothetical protein